MKKRNTTRQFCYSPGEFSRFEPFSFKKKKLKMRFDDFFFSNHEFNRVLKIGRSYLFCELQG